MSAKLHDPDHRWLSRRAAASYLHMALSTFDKLVRGGEIRKYHAAGLRTPLYDRHELDSLVRPA